MPKKQMTKQEWLQSVDQYKCQMCFAEGQDKRVLSIRCLYDFSEVVQEMVQELDDLHHKLIICKACRGRLTDMLFIWRGECVKLREVEKDMDGYVD